MSNYIIKSISARKKLLKINITEEGDHEEEKE
jgi:hypothetical protein